MPRARIFVDELAPDEADALAEIHARRPSPAPGARDDFAALLADRAVFALAARRESIFGRRRLVGFVLVRVAADEAEILTIAVRATQPRPRLSAACSWRRRSAASIASAIAACFLEVDRANRPAVGLYRSLGFEVVGERKRYYAAARRPGDGTALVMRVQLR